MCVGGWGGISKCKVHQHVTFLDCTFIIVIYCYIIMTLFALFLGRRRRPYIVFRNRFLYGFMFVYIYII